MAAVTRAPDFHGTAAWSAKAEGLGLGGIVMPVELGGTLPAPDPPSDSRYQALQKQSRHAPSHSSPPSLAPFAASLKDAPPPSSSAKTSQTPITARKYSLQNVSGEMISYPMVSRIDLAPTYIPPPTVPPIPSTKPKSEAAPPVTPTTPSSAEKKTKSRPPPIKLPTSGHASFLSPFKGRFAATHKEPSPDRETPGGDKSKLKAKKSKAELRIEENKAAFAAHFPDAKSTQPAAPTTTVEDDDDDEDTLTISLPPKSATPPTSSAPPPVPPVPSSQPLSRSASRPERVPVPPLGSPFGKPDLDASTSQSSSRPLHRRGVSDESPQVVQEAFARVVASEVGKPRPYTVFASSGSASSSRRPSRASISSEHPAPPEGLASRRQSRARSISSAAGLPKPDDAFFAPSVGAPSTTASTTTSASATRRPSAVPPAGEGVSQVGISVREGGGASARELGRAFFAEDGLTVSLRSYHRPEDLEVGWVCVPSVDDDGRPFVTYEIRLRPRVGAVDPATLDPTTPTKASSRARQPSTTGSAFFNYRMNGPPPVVAPPPQDPAGFHIPGSPRTGKRRPSVATAPRDEPPPRKYSSHRSEGSFSSESSTTGPSTPRRGKLSNASLFSVNHPPFDLDAVLASKPSAVPPLSATSSTFDHDELRGLGLGLPPGRRKFGRASSVATIAEQHRSRQFSIDEEGILNSRAASFSVGHGAVTMPPKSPKHHRFGCYIPPVNPRSSAEFVALSKEHKRRSQEAAALEASGATRQRKQSIVPGGGDVPPLPSLTLGEHDGRSSPAPRSFLASRGRKQSIAPPAALVIPPTISTSSTSPLSAGERISPASAVSAPPALGSLAPLPSPAPTIVALTGQDLDFRTPTAVRHSLLTPTSAPAVVPINGSLAAPTASTPASIASTTPPSPPPPVVAVSTGLLFPPSSAHATNGNGKKQLGSYPFPTLNGNGHGIGNGLSRDSSPSPSPSAATDSSFGNDIQSLSLSDVSDLDEASDDEDEDVKAAEVFEARLAKARQAKRLASKWSDTEDENGGTDEDSEEGPQTSWSKVPDAEESD
ncbi:hypothetical protein JCM8097_006849 [Rhodosporidiobolus ruineniae]